MSQPAARATLTRRLLQSRHTDALERAEAVIKEIAAAGAKKGSTTGIRDFAATAAERMTSNTSSKKAITSVLRSKVDALKEQGHKSARVEFMFDASMTLYKAFRGAGSRAVPLAFFAARDEDGATAFAKYLAAARELSERDDDEWLSGEQRAVLRRLCDVGDELLHVIEDSVEMLGDADVVFDEASFDHAVRALRDQVVTVIKATKKCEMSTGVRVVPAVTFVVDQPSEILIPKIVIEMSRILRAALAFGRSEIGLAAQWPSAVRLTDHVIEQVISRFKAIAPDANKVPVKFELAPDADLAVVQLALRWLDGTSGDNLVDEAKLAVLISGDRDWTLNCGAVEHCDKFVSVYTPRRMASGRRALTVAYEFERAKQPEFVAERTAHQLVHGGDYHPQISSETVASLQQLQLSGYRLPGASTAARSRVAAMLVGAQLQRRAPAGQLLLRDAVARELADEVERVRQKLQLLFDAGRGDLPVARPGTVPLVFRADEREDRVVGGPGSTSRARLQPGVARRARAHVGVRGLMSFYVPAQRPRRHGARAGEIQRGRVPSSQHKLTSTHLQYGSAPEPVRAALRLLRQELRQPRRDRRRQLRGLIAGADPADPVAVLFGGRSDLSPATLASSALFLHASDARTIRAHTQMVCRVLRCNKKEARQMLNQLAVALAAAEQRNLARLQLRQERHHHAAREQAVEQVQKRLVALNCLYGVDVNVAAATTTTSDQGSEEPTTSAQLSQEPVAGECMAAVQGHAARAALRALKASYPPTETLSEYDMRRNSRDSRRRGRATRSLRELCQFLTAATLARDAESNRSRTGSEPVKLFVDKGSPGSKMLGKRMAALAGRTGASGLWCDLALALDVTAESQSTPIDVRVCLVPSDAWISSYAAGAPCVPSSEAIVSAAEHALAAGDAGADAAVAQARELLLAVFSKVGGRHGQDDAVGADCLDDRLDFVLEQLRQSTSAVRAAVHGVLRAVAAEACNADLLAVERNLTASATYRLAARRARRQLRGRPHALGRQEDVDVDALAIPLTLGRDTLSLVFGSRMLAVNELKQLISAVVVAGQPQLQQDGKQQVRTCRWPKKKADLVQHYLTSLLQLFPRLSNVEYDASAWEQFIDRVVGALHGGSGGSSGSAAAKQADNSGQNCSPANRADSAWPEAARVFNALFKLGSEPELAQDADVSDLHVYDAALKQYRRKLRARDKAIAAFGPLMRFAGPAQVGDVHIQLDPASSLYASISALLARARGSDNGGEQAAPGVDEPAGAAAASHPEVSLAQVVQHMLAEFSARPLFRDSTVTATVTPVAMAVLKAVQHSATTAELRSEAATLVQQLEQDEAVAASDAAATLTKKMISDRWGLEVRNVRKPARPALQSREQRDVLCSGWSYSFRSATLKREERADYEKQMHSTKSRLGCVQTQLRPEIEQMLCQMRGSSVGDIEDCRAQTHAAVVEKLRRRVQQCTGATASADFVGSVIGAAINVRDASVRAFASQLVETEIAAAGEKKPTALVRDARERAVKLPDNFGKKHSFEKEALAVPARFIEIDPDENSEPNVNVGAGTRRSVRISVFPYPPSDKRKPAPDVSFAATLDAETLRLWHAHKHGAVGVRTAICERVWLFYPESGRTCDMRFQFRVALGRADETGYDFIERTWAEREESGEPFCVGYDDWGISRAHSVFVSHPDRDGHNQLFIERERTRACKRSDCQHAHDVGHSHVRRQRLPAWSKALGNDIENTLYVVDELKSQGKTKRASRVRRRLSRRVDSRQIEFAQALVKRGVFAYVAEPLLPKGNGGGLSRRVKRKWAALKPASSYDRIAVHLLRHGVLAISFDESFTTLRCGICGRAASTGSRARQCGCSYCGVLGDRDGLAAFTLAGFFLSELLDGDTLARLERDYGHLVPPSPGEQ